MSAITYRPAWRKADPELERDAIAFWAKREKLLPRGVNPEARAKELCAVAYLDGKTVGVSTATLEPVPQLRCRMAVYRCAVAVGMRHQPLSWTITDYSREVLEQWSLENPNEKVMGLLAILQAREFVERYPMIVGPANMAFVGFTQNGYPIRVAWFKHAAIPTDWPPKPLPRGPQAQGPRGGQ